MRYNRLLTLALFCSLQVYGQKSDYIFEQISSDAGITYSAISCIVEDKSGFIWFGGSNGLFFYNTADIIKYPFDPEKADTPPSNNIIDLYRDQEDRIWVCTDNGLCFFNESENAFIRVPLKEGGKQLDKTSVSSILQYDDSTFLALINSQLYQFNPARGVLHKIIIENINNIGISYLGMTEDKQIFLGTTAGDIFISEELASNYRLFYKSVSGNVSTLCLSKEHIFIGYRDNGMDVTDRDGNIISRYRQENNGVYQIPHNHVRKIIKRKNGAIWVGTLGGILVISTEGNQIIRPDFHNGLPHMGIFELYPDRNDGIWVGTWSGGLTYYHDLNFRIPHITQTINNTPLSMNVISSFAEDMEGKIWVGSENYGLYSFDPGKMKYEESEKHIKWPISRIKSITSDQDNRHWIGTFSEGLWVMENNKLTRIGDINGIFSSLLTVENGIWIGDREGGGLIFYDTNTKTFKKYNHEINNIASISSNGVWDIFLDSRGDLWVCSNFGLSVKRKDEEIFRRYYFNENQNSLSSNMVYSIEEDRTGKLWIGTSGGGIDIYDPEKDSFSKFKDETIENADVYCILQDKDHNIWFSSNQGIYVYYPQRNELKNFTREDGLLGNQYHPNSAFLSSKGQLYFGGGNGFNIIDPDAVKQNVIKPDAYLSKLFINNLPIEEFEPRYVNAKFPAAIEKLELNYNQNSIAINFVANSAIKSSNNRFRYRMYNYQDVWTEIKQGADVSFVKIPPGEYTLEVMASNSDGVWSQSPRTIQIKIRPPFWSAWYAYLFYIIVFVLVLYWIIREQRFRAKAKADETLFSEKVTFFTNISHEFRTPLTLVLSPLNSLLKKVTHDPEMVDQISTVKRNANRLLRLTNQMLDFRMIELNKSKLNTGKHDLVTLCRNVYDCFEFQVSEKEINMIFNSSFRTLVMPVDEEKIDKVVYNLISNALKYSPEKAQVILSMEQKKLDQDSYSNVFYTGNQFYGKALEIEVRDNGKGMRSETIPRIFDRFFVDHSESETGTGIGLHICQEYVLLHNGNIMVTSKPEDGSSFIVNLPMEGRMEYEKENVILQTHFDPLPQIKSEELHESDNKDKSNVVLYAEDNDDMRIYMKKLLASKFKVLTAKNGQQAYEIVAEVIPDIIITDVIMPGMDGMELTVKVKSNPETNHIPVIILTALSEDHHKIESMKKGVHTFITKPVDDSFLLAKIENIFTEREVLKKKYGENKVEENVSTGRNKTFIEKAEDIVEMNLRNPAFEISEFASQLSISKSSLQRKIKASTNMNPSEFIRDFRLKRATEFLKQGDLNIDEIALLAGFNSTSYFIRTFKSKYGKTPLAFKTELSDK